MPTYRAASEDILPNSPLARGRTADVYAWDDGWVLKLFHDWFPREDIEYEARIGRLVHAGGLPVPVVGEIIEVDGRHGLTYERLAGPSMMEALGRSPWRAVGYARRLATLHARMHALESVPQLPLQHQRLESKLRSAEALPERLRSAALSALQTMPAGDRLCHGDLHPGNVLLTANGDIVIDWIGATRGIPLADVARTTILTLGAAASEQIPNPFLKLFASIFDAAYRRAYFRLRPGGQREYRRWMPIIAAARLDENIPEIEAWLIDQAQKIV